MIAAMSPLSRRRFIKLVAAFAALPAGFVGARAYASRIEPWQLSVEQVEVRSPRVPLELDGLKIGQLSDLHLGGAIDAAFVKRAVATLNKHKPDIAVVTGDLIHVPGIAAALVDALNDLRAPLGSYVTLGNHDHWHDAPVVAAALREAGHVVLQNERIAVSHGGAPLQLVGVDDVWERKNDLPRAIAGMSGDGPALLFVHEPDFADEAAALYPFIAQFSGHTHGGQVRLPFIGAPARAPFGKKYIMGAYDVNGVQLYVTRGIGMAVPYYRFMCPPEVTIATLRAGLAVHTMLHAQSRKIAQEAPFERLTLRRPQ
jgi:uncharacterized protein